MIRRPPRSTRTDTLFPYTTLFRSGLFLLLQVGRFWVLRTLGTRWTTRVIVLPGEPLVTGGPFRFVRHPNYVIVAAERSEEHTSELQSLLRISYAVFCLKKNNQHRRHLLNLNRIHIPSKISST